MPGRGGLYASLYQRQFLAQPTPGQEAGVKLGERNFGPLLGGPA
ncbi:MAG: hypothetical protein ACRDPD_18850 [Streptosporangiaceae bacterium]